MTLTAYPKMTTLHKIQNFEENLLPEMMQKVTAYEETISYMMEAMDNSIGNDQYVAHLEYLQNVYDKITLCSRLAFNDNKTIETCDKIMDLVVEIEELSRCFDAIANAYQNAQQNTQQNARQNVKGIEIPETTEPKKISTFFQKHGGITDDASALDNLAMLDTNMSDLIAKADSLASSTGAIFKRQPKPDATMGADQYNRNPPLQNTQQNTQQTNKHVRFEDNLEEIELKQDLENEEKAVIAAFVLAIPNMLEKYNKYSKNFDMLVQYTIDNYKDEHGRLLVMKSDDVKLDPIDSESFAVLLTRVAICKCKLNRMLKMAQNNCEIKMSQCEEIRELDEVIDNLTEILKFDDVFQMI